jgi:hypothetical protein
MLTKSVCFWIVQQRMFNCWLLPLLENIVSPASTISPVATSERKRKEEQKNPVTKTVNHITKTVNWKPDIDDGWTLVKRKMRSQQKIESNQSIVNS